MIRDIIVIDEELCDGCGECVPSCEEGALQVVNGKVRLVADRLCDGLGACLGHCPTGALRVEQREAVEFDEQAVATANTRPSVLGQPVETASRNPPEDNGGCPSMRFNHMDVQPAARPTTAHEMPAGEGVSALAQWPVQLRLLPPHAPALRGARLLLCADCVPFALADFHKELLQGRTVVVACPKLDPVEPYLQKLVEMIRTNHLAEITVARMEVPCCGGLMMLASQARQLSGIDVPIQEIVVSTRGQIVARRAHTVVPEE